MSDDETTKDWEAFRVVLDLWKQENPIKTTKLQVLLAVNGGLVSVVAFSGGFIRENWIIYALGAFLSGVWVLSIGRTTLYQQLWKHKLDRLSRKHPQDPRFQVRDVTEVKGEPGPFLRAVGGVSSKFYLLGAPIFLCALWLVLLGLALS